MSIKQKKTKPDSKLSAIVGTVFGVLVIGFALGWFYLQHLEKQATEVSYLKLPSVAISRDGHSIAATFAFRTSAGDAEWATRNQQALEQVMRKVLLELDPEKVLAPNGLLTFQQGLRDAINTTMQTSRIQEVVVTDFLVSEADL